jgi:hypothetical protein
MNPFESDPFSPDAAVDSRRARQRMKALVAAWCLTSVLVGLYTAARTVTLERENQRLRLEAASYRRAAANADEKLWNCHGLVENLAPLPPPAPHRVDGAHRAPATAAHAKLSRRL